VLVSALGNAVNTGISLAPGGNRLMNAGTAPILVEPIRAKLTLSKLTGAPLVYALGPSGERRPLPGRGAWPASPQLTSLRLGTKVGA
jgi:hypothetical protein